ncbi:MAG: DUF6492 family protein [Candidatus Baltobacteraceae bacterium]
MNEQGIAFITPSFSRDLESCRDLNESILTFATPEAKHYIIVDACDLKLFQGLQNSRTVVVAVEDVIPKGYVKLRFSKKWWFAMPAMVPAKGWLVQQIVKLSAPTLAKESLLVNVDSDVRFVRRVDRALFVRDGRTRMYRLPGGVRAGMPHVKWHRNVCRLLGVKADELPMDDYVGNVISWDREIVLGALERIERITGRPWHVAFTRARSVGEQLVYGLYVDKVIGAEAAGVWTDERSWCHTYWGPGPLSKSKVEEFTRSMRAEDVAFSIAGYTGTSPEVTEAATQLAMRLAASS